MARIARSEQPLYQTKGRSVSWPVTMTNPDGSAMSLTGTSVSARLIWSGVSRSLAVSTLGASGTFTVSGDAAAAQDIPIGRIAELAMSLTDSQGAVTDYVWPVVGEVP